MVQFLLRWFINGVALGVAAWAVPGIWVDRWQTLIPVALIFGLANATVGLLLKLMTCPLILLTLGLFLLVVNALMLQLTSWLAGVFDLGFGVDGFWPAFFGALIVSLVSLVLTLVVGDPDDRNAS